jgi:hypothetical protein
MTCYWVVDGEVMEIYFLLWLFFTLFFVCRYWELLAFTFDDTCFVAVFLLDAFMVVWSGSH